MTATTKELFEDYLMEELKKKKRRLWNDLKKEIVELEWYDNDERLNKHENKIDIEIINNNGKLKGKISFIGLIEFDYNDAYPEGIQNLKVVYRKSKK